ncbi:MAG TPA: LemA family protein, partial [Pirellulales bacterium]
MSTGTSTAAPAPAAGGLGGMKWIALIGIAVLVGLWFMSVNNNLVGLQESVKQQQGQVENVLQRRFDLIPNLVATVKGYAEHEKDTFEEIARLRSQWGEAKTLDEKARISDAMSG